MLKAFCWQSLTLSAFAGLGCLLGTVSGPAIAAMNETAPAAQPSFFQRIEQPLSNKLIVTAIGLGLIGLDLWWFLGSKPRSR